MIKNYRPLAALVLVSIFFCTMPFSCRPRLKTVADRRMLMGTFVEIVVLGEDEKELGQSIEAAYGRIAKIESLMSPYREGSDVKRLNDSAGRDAIEVSPETIDVLVKARHISEISGGAFDATVAGFRGLWSFKQEEARVPSEEEISGALEFIDWRGVEIDRAAGKARLSRPGLRLDLGGIAKGYAVDEAIGELKSRGVTMGSVNAGGDLRVIGGHGSRPWRIGIQHPRSEEDSVAWLPISDKAVATSGDYEKFIVVDGKYYCHIIDPRTGRPASSLSSVTIVADEAWMADAMATAVFVLGPRDGLELIRKTDGIEAVLIDKFGRRIESAGLAGRVNWLFSEPSRDMTSPTTGATFSVPAAEEDSKE